MPVHGVNRKRMYVVIGTSLPCLKSVIYIKVKMASSTLEVYITFLCSIFLYVSPCPMYDECFEQLVTLQSEVTNGSADIVQPCVQLLQGDLPCFRRLVAQCQTLDTEQILDFRSVQETLKDVCIKLCPIMNDVKTCIDNIDHSALERSKHEFCESFDTSFRCFQSKLDDKLCPIGSRLFKKLADQDSLRLGQYLCNAGCSDIDNAASALEVCSSNVKNSDTSCSTYQRIKFCIKGAEVCPEALQMMAYYKENFPIMESKCSVTSTTTSTTELVPSIVTTSTEALPNSRLENCTQRLKSLSDVCKTVNCLKDNDILRSDISQQEIVREKLLQSVIDEWHLCSVTTRDSRIEKATTAQIITSEPALELNRLTTAAPHQSTSSDNEVMDSFSTEPPTSGTTSGKSITSDPNYIQTTVLSGRNRIMTTAINEDAKKTESSFIPKSEKVAKASKIEFSSVVHTEKPSTSLSFDFNQTTQKQTISEPNTYHDPKDVITRDIGVTNIESTTNKQSMSEPGTHHTTTYAIMSDIGVPNIETTTNKQSMSEASTHHKTTDVIMSDIDITNIETTTNKQSMSEPGTHHTTTYAIMSDIDITNIETTTNKQSMSEASTHHTTIYAIMSDIDVTNIETTTNKQSMSEASTHHKTTDVIMSDIGVPNIETTTNKQSMSEPGTHHKTTDVIMSDIDVTNTEAVVKLDILFTSKVRQTSTANNLGTTTSKSVVDDVASGPTRQPENNTTSPRTSSVVNQQTNLRKITSTMLPKPSSKATATTTLRKITFGNENKSFTSTTSKSEVLTVRPIGTSVSKLITSEASTKSKPAMSSTPNTGQQTDDNRNGEHRIGPLNTCIVISLLLFVLLC